MFRSIPVSNKLCFDKQVKRCYKIHEQKMIRLKSSVGKHRPERFDFLDQRPKKIALQEMRDMEVDRQNHVLLRKIKDIETKGCKNTYFKLESQPKKKTLNQPFRKRELVKIVEENQEILKRLQHKRSAYNIKKMQHQRKEIEKNINLISEFPYKDYPVTHTAVNFWATSEGFYHNPLHSSQVKESRLTYKGYKKLGSSNYIITSYTSKGQFYVQVENLQNKGQKYRIQLPEQQAQQLISSSYANRIENLIDNLVIDDNKQFCYLKYAQGE